MTFVSFAVDRLGQWSAAPYGEITAEAVAAFAAASNDPCAAQCAGELAPPAFAAVPVGPALAQAVMGFVPPGVLPLLVHHTQDIVIERPIRPGDDLTASAAIVGLRDSAMGVIVAARAITTDREGRRTSDQWVTVLFRGIHHPSAGEEPADHSSPSSTRASRPDAVVKFDVDADQPARYAEASGDHNPIHLDPAFARAVGLPGVIVHGVCTLAMSTGALIQELGWQSASIRRIAARFARIVLPGEPLMVRGWAAEPDRVHFSTVNHRGRPVVSDGLVDRSASPGR